MQVLGRKERRRSLGHICMCHEYFWIIYNQTGKTSIFCRHRLAPATSSASPVETQPYTGQTCNLYNLSRIIQICCKVSSWRVKHAEGTLHEAMQSLPVVPPGWALPGPIGCGPGYRALTDKYPTRPGCRRASWSPSPRRKSLPLKWLLHKGSLRDQFALGGPTTTYCPRKHSTLMTPC